MCGRFVLNQTAAEIEAVFGVMDYEGGIAPRFNIAPTQPVLMIGKGYPRAPGSNLPDRCAILVRWGLLPSWVKDVKGFPLLFNARSETAGEKATFRAALRHHRTLVPASGFYEWKRTGKAGAQPYLIRPKRGGLIAFAGLMETYLDPNGSEMDTGAILTTNANETLAPIHHRMPVVIQEEDFERWLDCINNEPRDVADLMRPVEPDFFEAIPVSDRVNKVVNDDPGLLDPAPDAPEPVSEERKADQLSLF
ncbi:SOS response-associated peptidase [Aliihoeflea aestuarii]|jgi:putative SOS response-associated peptidase YedK|uniref:SOS response-associated peptidase n=1 Tax=Aliihoeflea aestuarii TaxID=453840 RepID=UPI0020942F17|nr:SOS response-associated peptidase [Aliihoeflea aestuarii]MCO6392798.1 SOS response-associated peptidase [Aliihoeflea aestuarii]